MLGAIEPILAFQIYKNVTTEETNTVASIPITTKVSQRATIAVIPIYLAELATGIYIDAESKNIDIDTNLDSLTSGESAEVSQKALGSITSVSLIGKKDSLGLTILLSLAEQLLDKASSKEYEVSYMNGAITVFGGLIHSLSFDQNREDDLIRIKVDFTRGRPRTKQVLVQEDPNAVRLGTTGLTPAPTAPLPPPKVPAGSPSGGQSVIKPRGLG